jgi:prolyl-tRNA synthetase
MIIKPYGYAIWEAIQRELDDRIKATGHENLYFPLLVPATVLAQEAELVEGFARGRRRDRGRREDAGAAARGAPYF